MEAESERGRDLTNRDASLSLYLVDPLARYQGIALFPRTLGCDLNPPDPNDLDAVHSRLKSMALRSPIKLQQQAKTILDSVSEICNFEVPSDVLSQVNKDGVDTSDNEAHRDRRPGLGRKRARFSLKPNSSQPTVSLEPNLDISQLKDPEEFFMAYERHENAKREIQKQMGGVFNDFDQQNPSTKPRQRRPGILGSNKRTVKYKHFHSSVLADCDDAPISCQEVCEQDILSPTQSSHQGTSGPNISSQSQKLDGSISKTETKIDGLLDELLSTRCEDLEGDEGFALLQEHLQIKPFVLEKLSLPGLQNIRRNDPKAFDGSSPKPRRALVDLQNLLGGASRKLPAKYNSKEGVIQNKGSPTPTKSPFASLLALKKRMLDQSDPLGDRYSFSIDTSPPRNASSPVDCSIEQSDPSDTLKDMCNSSKLKPLRILEDESIVAEPCSPKDTTGDSPDQNEKFGDDILMRSSSGLKSLRTDTVGEPSTRTDTVGEPSTPMVTRGDVSDQSEKSGDDGSRAGFGSSGIDERIVNENLSMPDADVDFRTEEVSAFQDNEVRAGDVPEAGALPVEDPSSTVDHLEQSSISTSKDHQTDGPPESMDIGAEQQLEKNQEPSSTSMNEPSKSKSRPGKRNERKLPSQMQNLDGGSALCEQGSHEAFRGSLNEQPKAKNLKERKKKDSSKRQSLAGAGTKWDGGVRKSTRFRTRPLEYWKGERLLYGRIHNSMSTVIGMKYVSPAKGGGNPTVKVKQIVSDKYKELVDKAAWH